jgi:hypothetical protein
METNTLSRVVVRRTRIRSGTDSLLKGYIPEKSGHNAKAHGEVDGS